MRLLGGLSRGGGGSGVAPFKIVVTGEPNVNIVHEAALTAFKKEARSAMRESQEELLRAVKAQLRKSKDPPAPPGQPPALRFEDQPFLMSSFRTMRVRVRKFSVTGGVFSDHPGAGRLEYGATDIRGITTFPHPYLGPAMKDAEPRIHNILSRVLADV
jgi:hypothetical protein